MLVRLVKQTWKNKQMEVEKEEKAKLKILEMI